MELQRTLECGCHRITSNGKLLSNVVWFYKKGVVGRQWKSGEEWYEVALAEDKDGYKVRTYLHGQKNIRINRLVGLMFIPNPGNLPIVCHVNGNKIDNRVENLYWGTHKSNAIDRERHKQLSTVGKWLLVL